MESCKYLLLNISLANHNFIQFGTQIINFNANKVYIDGDINNYQFKVISAIRFLPTNENNCTNGGHYIIWKQHEHTWQVINGDRMLVKSNFISKLDKICIILLEKVENS